MNVPIIGPAIAPSANQIPEPLQGLSGPYAQAIFAATRAPYLRGLLAQDDQRAKHLAEQGPDLMVAQALQALHAAGDLSLEEGMAALRRAKSTLHLAIAIADLSQAWPLARITRAISDGADAALAAALRLAAAENVARGDLQQEAANLAPAIPGLIVIAMGKHGAFELNYSSDVDVTIFFDPARFPATQRRGPQQAAVRLAQSLVRILEEPTADNYVFRVDLRLRPDPGATPVVVSLPAAEHYYQTLGQNWERAAFIKARACGGDLAAGEEFLRGLSPFIWRRHLDYAAIADIQSIKRQIRAGKGKGELADPVFNVKLGRGGIRDIELFAQTQQLILGGRDVSLRDCATIGALAALARAGHVSHEDEAALAQCYQFLRHVEHRVQMLEDAQTHQIPAREPERDALAALCGFSTRAAFEHDLVRVRHIVSSLDSKLFADAPTLADPLGSLSFTGVEDDAETLQTLRGLGFSDPAFVSQTIRGWHHGRIRAMRAERARELLTALTPALLRAVSQVGEPDVAFRLFTDFFGNLPAGVQTLSLFQAHPEILRDLAEALALAPRLAGALGKRPALLDAIIDPRADPSADEDFARLEQEIVASDGFEASLNRARRLHREAVLLIDLGVLRGRIGPELAGRRHADLAEACVCALMRCALRETERLRGPAPGAACVLAFGKFGGRELSEGSDLDIVVIYDAPNSEGADFYTRFTQRLVTALSARTEEGELYEVDMQLRPSGSAGPVAVRLSSFAHYYAEEAWTWELQALTRMRPVAGDLTLGEKALATARAALTKPRPAQPLLEDVCAMRARIARDKPDKGPWDLKLAPGGLVDLEFIAQGLQLVGAAAGKGVVRANTGEAFVALREAGLLSPPQAETLIAAFQLLSHLQQWLRIVCEGPFDPAAASQLQKLRLAQRVGAQDFSTLDQRLQNARKNVQDLFLHLIGRPSDGSALCRR